MAGNSSLQDAFRNRHADKYIDQYSYRHDNEYSNRNTHKYPGWWTDRNAHTDPNSVLNQDAHKYPGWWTHINFYCYICESGYEYIDPNPNEHPNRYINECTDLDRDECVNVHTN